MTKSLSKELIDRFCTEIGIEFAEGSDGIALSIHGLERGRVRDEVESLLVGEPEARHNLRSWKRTDLGSKVFRTSSKNGPPWHDVVARVTADAGD